MSTRATHIVDATGDAAYAAALLDRERRVLCDKRLYYENPKHPYQTREATVSIGAFRHSRPKKQCRECWRLARMSPADRAIARSLKEQAKGQALAKLKAKSDAKRRELRAERMVHIDAMRVDALAVLDAFHAERELPQRCPAFVRVTEDTKVRCALPALHQGASAMGLRSLAHVAKPDGSGVVSTRDVLAAAVDLYKLDHKSGGDKLIVMQSGTRLCRSCGAEHELTTLADRGPVGPFEYSAGSRCSDCHGTLSKIGRASKRHVVCRFCRKILGRNQDPFGDFERARFTNVHGKLIIHDDDVGPEGFVDVWRHTVECALNYLIDQPQTCQDDAPIVVPGSMPATSFVLEHDR